MMISKSQEGYFLSDKNLSINLDKFESNEVMKLLIFGHRGSGKSTIGKILSKKYKVPLLEIDQLYWNKRYKIKLSRQYLEIIVKLIKMLKDNKRMIIEGVDWINLYKNHKKYRPIMLKQSMIILGLSSWKSSLRVKKRYVPNKILTCRSYKIFEKNLKQIEKDEVLNTAKSNYKLFEKTLKKIRNDVKNIALEYNNDKQILKMASRKY